MNRLLNNWPLKLVSLLLALGLWGHVRGESNPLETATYTVRLNTIAPDNLHLNAPNLPPTVRVTVRAPHQELRLLSGPTLPLPNPLVPETSDAPPVQNGALRASLDFSAVPLNKADAQLIPIRVESNNEEVEILGVKPASVSVTLSKVR